MSRTGFTFIETLTVLVVVTAIMGLGTPMFRRWLKREAVRAARQEVTTHLAQARAVAVQRGCQTVLHFDGAATRVWLTSCRAVGVGTDTVGGVHDLGDRHGVKLAVDGDSLVFTPQGIAYGTSWITVAVSKGGYTRSVEISPVGNALW